MQNNYSLATKQQYQTTKTDCTIALIVPLENLKNPDKHVLALNKIVSIGKKRM